MIEFLTIQSFWKSTYAATAMKFLLQTPSALQMFCLQNTQMFVCVKNSKTNIGCFCVYLSVMDNKYFDVVFTLNQTLNLLKNKHFLSNLQKKFCCFYKLFSYWQNFLSFFAGYEIWFDLNRHLSVIIAAFKNIQKYMFLFRNKW